MNTEQKRQSADQNPNAFPLHLFFEGRNYEAQRFFGRPIAAQIQQPCGDGSDPEVA
ncbi:MAG: hypothetical protein J5722_06390 [Oscillospiraceae bacterium]|nr:hypothetical protein [Oscillospiraceae bacterium]